MLIAFLLAAALPADSVPAADPAPEEPVVYEFNIEEIIRQHTYSDDLCAKRPPRPSFLPEKKKIETFYKEKRDPKTGKMLEDGGIKVTWES